MQANAALAGALEKEKEDLNDVKADSQLQVLDEYSHLAPTRSNSKQFTVDVGGDV